MASFSLIPVYLRFLDALHVAFSTHASHYYLVDLFRELSRTASYHVVCHDSRVTLRLLLILRAGVLRYLVLSFVSEKRLTVPAFGFKYCSAFFLLFMFHSPTLIMSAAEGYHHRGPNVCFQLPF